MQLILITSVKTSFLLFLSFLSFDFIIRSITFEGGRLRLLLVSKRFFFAKLTVCNRLDFMRSFHFARRQYQSSDSLQICSEYGLLSGYWLLSRIPVGVRFCAGFRLPTFLLTLVFFGDSLRWQFRVKRTVPGTLYPKFNNSSKLEFASPSRFVLRDPCCWLEHSGVTAGNGCTALDGTSSWLNVNYSFTNDAPAITISSSSVVSLSVFKLESLPCSHEYSVLWSPWCMLFHLLLGSCKHLFQYMEVGPRIVAPVHPLPNPLA